MKFVLSAFITLALLLGICYGQDELNPEVERLIEEFDRGNIESAEILALKALQKGDFFTLKELETIHLYLGYCYIATGERESARRQFYQALEINPNLKLDPLYISPKILAVFNEAREEFRNAVSTVQSHKDNNLAKLNISASWRSLILPGWGQIYKGERKKGYILIGIDFTLLSTLAVLQWKYQNSREKYLDAETSQDIADKYDTYNLYYKARNIAALVSIGLYTYSYLDCMYGKPSAQKASINIVPKYDGIALIYNF